MDPLSTSMVSGQLVNPQTNASMITSARQFLSTIVYSLMKFKMLWTLTGLGYTIQQRLSINMNGKSMEFAGMIMLKLTMKNSQWKNTRMTILLLASILSTSSTLFLYGILWISALATLKVMITRLPWPHWDLYSDKELLDNALLLEDNNWFTHLISVLD